MNITASEIEARFVQHPDQDIFELADELFESEARSVADALSLIRMSRLFFEAANKLRKSKPKRSKNRYRIGEAFLSRAQATLESVEHANVEARIAKKNGVVI